MTFLCSELNYAAEHNQVLQLFDVCVHYNELAQESNTDATVVYQLENVVQRKANEKSWRLILIRPATYAGHFRERTTTCSEQILP